MPNANRRFILLLSIVFFLSGFSSLAYQVAWQRILTLFYGVGSISTTIIVSIYMAGLGLGSLAGGYLAERIQNRVRFYCWVQLLVGLFGLFSLPLINGLGRATAGSSYLLASLYIFLLLSIPTFLMGLTLPFLTKIFNQIRQNFFQTVSLLYFINTIGAAAGALLTSYILISFFGLDIAVYTAAVIDILLGVVVLLAARGLLSQAAPQPAEASRAAGPTGEQVQAEASVLGRWAYLLVFLTGFLALGLEIIWFRMISVLVKDSPYAFSTILAIYLLGVALGSLAAHQLLKKYPGLNRRGLFFLMQFLVGVTVILAYASYFYLTRDTPFRQLTEMSFRHTLHPDPQNLYTFLDIFLWPLWFLFWPTFFMGASFPLVSSLASTRGNDEGWTVGRVFFFNIMGNVFGSIATGFIILPRVGSERALFLFAMTSLCGIWLVTRLRRRALPLAWRGALFALALGFALLIFPQRGAYYRLIHPDPEDYQQVVGEGVDTVVVSYHNYGPTLDFMNGIAHGQFGTEWYYSWVNEAASFAPALDNVLVIGFGSGTFPSVLEKMDDLGKLTVVELSPTLIRNRAGIPFYDKMLAHPRLNLVLEDGRQYLLRSEEQYDLILMDPLPATTSYANNLHSKEFFELAKSRLKPGGVFLIGGVNDPWVVPKTMASVFNHLRVYELFILASDTELVKDMRREEEIFAGIREDNRSLVSHYLNKVYLGDQAFILTNARRYPINREWRPHSEYYLGLRALEQLHLLP